MMKKQEIRQNNRQKSLKKREAILNSAMQEFLTNGYAGTTMDQIAKTAAISKATVYNHFGDKENLFAAIIEHLAQEKFQTIFDTQQPELMEKEPKIVLQYLASQILNNSLYDQQFHGFIRIIIGESGRFPHLAQIYLHHLVKPALARLNQYLINQEKFKNTDTEAMVRIFVGTLVHFVILQSLLDGKDIVPMESDRLVNTLVNLLT